MSKKKFEFNTVAAVTKPELVLKNDQPVFLRFNAAPSDPFKKSEAKPAMLCAIPAFQLDTGLEVEVTAPAELFPILARYNPSYFGGENEEAICFSITQHKKKQGRGEHPFSVTEITVK